MEFGVSRSKVVRKFLTTSAVMIAWVLAWHLGVVWLAEARRLQGESLGSALGLHFGSAVFALIWLLAVTIGAVAHRRSGFRLTGRRLSFRSAIIDLGGPAFLEGRSLIVTGDSGPVRLENIYDLSLEVIRERLNKAWSGEELSAAGQPPAFPHLENGVAEVDEFIARLGSGRRGGPVTVRDWRWRWILSPGWINAGIVLLLGISMLIEPHLPQARPGSAQRITFQDWVHSMELLRNAGVAFFLALIAWPWFLTIAAQPTCRVRRWMLVSPRYLIVSDRTLRIIPTGAVSEVETIPPGRKGGGLLRIRCSNGLRVIFPDPALEPEAVAACGLDPNRHLSIADCAARLGCSKARAAFALACVPGIRTAGGSIRRAVFETHESGIRSRVGGRSG